MRDWGSVVVLSGGVGGSRLVAGLARVLPAEALTVVVNTGDDFEHWGLTICPDLDTVMYTLAGVGDRERGWGVADDTFAALEMMDIYGEEAWFRLGDRDLATHLTRSRLLAEGHTLTEVTARLCAALDVGPRLLPMCDPPRRTLIVTRQHGLLPMQQWLVGHRAEPAVRRVVLEPAAPAAGVVDAIGGADVVVIAPSNPYVSIDPILSLAGVREAVARRPVVAVSPIVSGAAVKGPLATMIRQIDDRPPSAGAVVAHYGGLVSAAVVERGDEAPLEVPCLGTETIMRSDEDRERLARELLFFAESVA